jgi:hypothetical protein
MKIVRFLCWFAHGLNSYYLRVADLYGMGWRRHKYAHALWHEIKQAWALRDV